MTTITLCERELADYMLRMTGEKGSIALFSENGASFLEEHYTIDVTGGRGSIRANRPRALLLGIYDFLRRCGCRFLRPGKTGEVIPRVPLESIDVHAEVSPASRHRGITIEGAVSLENVLDLIEWAPKAGFNSYFIQFRTAFEFFDRWYSHAGNDLIPREPFSEEDAARFVRLIAEKVKERDMIFHAVGHGWTAACVGISADGWKGMDDDLTDRQRGMLAEIGGKRGFFNGIPLNTNLCYSDPAVRERMAEEVVSYAAAHPEVDVLHLWLADDSNNVCECAACAERRFSDWYVMMLNEIDRRLTALHIRTKICFLVYLDLYWAPETEQIRNQDRFIMMFAPIFRSYAKPYDCSEAGEPLRYVRNKVVYPHTTAPYVRFLRDWQAQFQGDSFDFDYHLMWDINRDLGGEIIAEVLYRDIRALPVLGLNGFMSCQIQRAFYPNGLAFYVMGRALFDGQIGYEALREEYYRGAFGKHAPFAMRFYETLERTVPFSYFKEETDGKTALPLLREAQAFLRKTLSEFPADAEDDTRRESLEILRFTAENALRTAEVLILKEEGAPAGQVQEAAAARRRFFNENELRFQPYADGFYVNMITDGFIDAKEVGIYAE